jgi:glycosyltransferase involved in cell wall biosynthesis
MSQTASYAVSLVLPVFNEEQVLDELLRRSSLLLADQDQAGRWEVIFVNDGSIDAPRQQIERLPKRSRASG